MGVNVRVRRSRRFPHEPDAGVANGSASGRTGRKPKPAGAEIQSLALAGSTEARKSVGQEFHQISSARIL
jgi:hypothetical protein